MDVRHFFFKQRSYTPIPLLIGALILAKPTWVTVGIGFGSVLLGEAIRFWGVAYAGSATRTTGKAGGDRLVTDGPFGRVRNPLYVGNFFLSFGFMIMCWAWMPWMALIHICLFAVQYTLIVSLEEEYLSERFGNEYTQYRKEVKRWIPRFSPYACPDRSQPNLAKTLQSERNTLQAIIAVSLLVLLRWHLL